MKSTWEGILASIFDGFWWVWGGKLGGKIEPRWIKSGIEKTTPKKSRPRWPKKAYDDAIAEYFANGGKVTVCPVNERTEDLVVNVWKRGPGRPKKSEEK